MSKKALYDKKILNLIEKNKGISLDVGCGESKQPGFVGMDIRPLAGVDIVHDLEVIPYPIPDNSCHKILASHIVEHINPHKGVFVNVMNEWWRIMKQGGQLWMALPYAGSPGYYQDPTHCNPCNEITWFYFDPTVQNSPLYNIYKPRPWKIISNVWNSVGNMEVVLQKL